MSKIGINSEKMQADNRTLILDILIQRGVCTRAELSRETGLTQASISKIVREMIEVGAVEEGGMVSGISGRRSIGISINRKLCKVVAVKISRKSFDVAVFWIGGELVEKCHKVVGVTADGPKSVMDEIKNQIKLYLSKYPDILSIGIAVPGPYLRSQGRIALMSGVSGWHKINLHDEMSEEFNLPICIEHDANAGVFAEWRYGRHYGRHDNKTLVCFLASDGIGAGIMMDGKILLGSNGVAGEIGHMSINLDGHKCICGNRGCLETYSSALSFAEFVKEDLKSHSESSLYNEDNITAQTVFEHMNAGDHFATEEVRKVGKYIGCGMVNIIYLYNPNEIIVTDIMTGGGEVLLNAAIEEVRSRTLSVLSKEVKICFSELEHDTILMGAAALASNLLLEMPERLYNMGTQ